jgi:hypothetical protein
VFVGNAAAPPGTARTLDDLLVVAVTHWDEAKSALDNGRIERWLRQIGEVYIADLAGELAAGAVRAGDGVAPPDAGDERLREFLFRSGLDLRAEADRRRREAETADRYGDTTTAERLRAEAGRLVPEKRQNGSSGSARLRRREGRGLLRRRSDRDGRSGAGTNDTPEGGTIVAAAPSVRPFTLASGNALRPSPSGPVAASASAAVLHQQRPSRRRPRQHGVAPASRVAGGFGRCWCCAWRRRPARCCAWPRPAAARPGRDPTFCSLRGR